VVCPRLVFSRPGQTGHNSDLLVGNEAGENASSTAVQRVLVPAHLLPAPLDFFAMPTASGKIPASSMGQGAWLDLDLWRRYPGKTIRLLHQRRRILSAFFDS
jgi:hypothetical protein